MNDNKALEALKRLKELQVKCLPDYDADEKTLHFKWYLDTPDAIELARMIIDLDEQMTDSLTELAEIKRRAEEYAIRLEEEKGKPYSMLLLGEDKVIDLINYILKGETK